ncbi:transcriptional regulator HexR [Parahaliea mediterranea]|uniref:Transcriptional regulator HexR n=1 Tax=Parahaliea mediterranea TaxID=651086 RepID=A0A939DES4_9GAMM|nr:transcriptional regulator HexR [Parahaliea mediterranea]MBN7796795.1 transcriptional regulator HexR [Parahaliea mediterranea]
MSLMAELRNTEARRSKSERKLIDYVLANPEAVLNTPIARLAAAVGVSEPTVNRFCRAMGAQGFPDFKLRLAGELARSRPSMTRDIEVGDAASHVAAKIFEATHASLDSAHNNLDYKALEKAVDALHDARAIVLCGLGASASVAQDAQHKLLRFDTPVTTHSDIINQRVAAAGLAEQDCLVCISYTGRTRAIVDIARMGRDCGATVIGLTAPGSALARACELVLAVEGGEDTELYTPMTSRIAQLVIIDVLVTTLALRKGSAFADRLRAAKHSLAGTRVR